MRPHTFRFLSGGVTPSNTAEVRFRFIDSTAIAVEDWTVTGPDDLDLAGSGYPGLSAGDLPRGGVSGPTTVLLALSSGQVSVGEDPQSLPSRGNDISMASDGPRVLVVVSQAIRDAGISYKADGTYSHPSGLWPIIPAELDTGYIDQGLAVRE
jgi:hypothetical protein